MCGHQIQLGDGAKQLSSSSIWGFGGGMSHILKMHRRKLWAMQRAHGGAGSGHGGDDCGTFRAGME